MGPLFVGELPVLEVDAGALAMVRTIIVGAEGHGTGRWRKQYERNENDVECWPLPDDVRRQGSGWYFIRLYNVEDDLIDSLDFRYIGGLRSVEVSACDVKHRLNENQVRVTFVHDEGVSVSMAETMPPLIEHSTQREPPSTLFAWSCDPSIREAAFDVYDRGRPVRITLDTDRIWWAIVDPSQEVEPVWKSSPIQTAPDAFTPTSNARLLIRFSRSSKVHALIGFQRNNPRPVPIRPEGLATLHLHEFSEAPDLNECGMQKLKLWVCGDGSEFELDIVNVSIPMKCPWCDSHMNEQNEMIDHILNQHHGQCFERLVLRGEGINNLTEPSALFLCLECGQFYPYSSLPEQNAITRMSIHCNNLHERMSYKRVHSPLDIRNLLGLEEKWVWKCKLGSCQPIVPRLKDEAALVDKKAHLKEEHHTELLRASERN
jgi:hypothetical protein